MKVNINNKRGAKPDTSAIDKLDKLPPTVDPDGLPNSQVVTPKDPEILPDDQNNPPQDPPDDPNEPDDPNVDPNVDLNEPPLEPNNHPKGGFDYQKKFAESSREAQILASKNRKLTETIEQASILPEPTEEELRKEYSDWDSLTDFEQKMAKNSLASSKKFNLIHQAVISTQQVDAWASKVDEFVATPANLQKYPDLEGREAEFRSFAMKESRRGLEMDELVGWFLAVDVVNPPAPKQKGSLLARPTGGQPPVKPQVMTVEQLAYIRKTDSRKYKQLVQSGMAKKVLEGKF